MNKRVLLSLLVSAAVCSMFTVNSFVGYANPLANESSTESSAAASTNISQATGILTGSGQFWIDGNEVASGSTVFSGNTISTARTGVVSIQLPFIGRVVVRPDTSITLTISDSVAKVSTTAEESKITVLRGEALVTSPSANRELKSGEEALFAQSTSATLYADTVLTIQNSTGQSNAADSTQNGQQGQQGGQQGTPPNNTDQNQNSNNNKRSFIAPWWGWLALAGVAGGIAAGVATHGGETASGHPPISPK